MLNTDLTVQEHIISSLSGVALGYAEYLPRHSTKSNILFVHGLASSRAQFHREAMRFAEQGFRVLVPDLLGHGLSGVPQGALMTDDFSIETMAIDLIEILDHAKATHVHWVGNSLGGILALWLLGTPHVGRLHSLAMFGTCFSMNLPRQVGWALRAAFLPGKAITARLTARATTASPVGRQAIETAIKQFNIGAGAAIAANVRQHNFHANTRSFQRPLLVLWGGLDRAVNLRLRGDLAKLADCQTVRRIDLPLAGHCANFDMHNLFCASLVAHWSNIGPLHPLN